MDFVNLNPGSMIIEENALNLNDDLSYINGPVTELLKNATILKSNSFDINS